MFPMQNPYSGVRPQQYAPPTYSSPYNQGPAPSYGGPNPAQFMMTLTMMMGAIQQLSAGWQGFAGVGQAAAIGYPQQSFGGHYGPIQPNPSPYSLLPAAQTSATQQIGYGSPPSFNYGPIRPNPSPYGLLPAAQTSAVNYNPAPAFNYGPIAPNPNPYSLLPAGIGSF